MLIATSVIAAFATITVGAHRPTEDPAVATCRMDRDSLDRPESGVRVRRILAPGDSATYGLFLPLESAYPSAAAGELRERGKPTTELDCAVLGAARADLPGQVRAAEGFPADVVTVLVGINDANPGVPDLASFDGCLRSVVGPNRTQGRETV